MSFVCIAYFEPKKFNLKQKFTGYSYFLLIKFLVRTLKLNVQE